MKIHSNTTQVDSTQFGARNVNDASMLATARGLAQKGIAPSPLLLTHLAVNAQIEALQQQKTSWASSSSSSGNSPIDTHILALQTLKNRGFQSAPNAELSIPLSGKGLMGGGKRTLGTTPSNVAQAAINSGTGQHILNTRQEAIDFINEQIEEIRSETPQQQALTLSNIRSTIQRRNLLDDAMERYISRVSAALAQRARGGR